MKENDEKRGIVIENREKDDIGIGGHGRAGLGGIGSPRTPRQNLFCITARPPCQNRFLFPGPPVKIDFCFPDPLSKSI